MPDPVPTPERFSREWWFNQLALILPNNWRQIVQWLILFAIITGINWIRGGKAAPIPVPEPPLPLFLVVPDGSIDEPTMEELQRRGVKVHCTGWKKPTQEETDATLRVLQQPHFRDTEAGNVVMGDDDFPVWRLAIKGRRSGIPARDQGQIGSCVSFGFAAAIEYTMAAQSAIGKQVQELPDICQEAIYAGSRVEVNGGRVPFNGDGSTGAWGAKWLETTGGALARGKYGALDLTAYSVFRCKQWGTRGVPDELEPEARKHKAKCSLVTSAAEAKKALAQGYAIAVCSDQGFSNTRDADGFARAQGSWAHCMAIIGYRADKPGFLILNSWGPSWITGAKGKFDDIPDGSFWATEATVDRMLKQRDSYAVANADGFRKRKIDPSDWIVIRQPERPRRDFNAFLALSP